MPRRKNRAAFARALVASLSIHALFAAFFVRSSESTALGARDGSTNGELVTVARVSHLSLDPPRVGSVRREPIPTPAASAALARPRAAVVRPAPVAHPSDARGLAAGASPHRNRPPADARRASAHAGPTRRSPLALTLATSAPERIPPSDEPTPTARIAALPAFRPTPGPPVDAKSPAPTAAPTPAPTAQLVARGDVPPGGWGQSFERPLIADETALDDLRARYPGTHAIRVDVDDEGRALRVTLPGGMPADARAALARALMEMRYVPAECNGLRCTGTLQLSL